MKESSEKEWNGRTYYLKPYVIASLKVGNLKQLCSGNTRNRRSGASGRQYFIKVAFSGATKDTSKTIYSTLINDFFFLTFSKKLNKTKPAGDSSFECH